MSSLKKRKNKGRGVKPDEVDESYSFSHLENLTTQNLLDEVEMRSMSWITYLKTLNNSHRASSNPCNPTHLTTHLFYSRNKLYRGSSNPCNLSSHTHAREENKKKKVAK